MSKRNTKHSARARGHGRTAPLLIDLTRGRRLARVRQWVKMHRRDFDVIVVGGGTAGSIGGNPRSQ